MRTLHLFAGAGGGILGDIINGHRPVCAVEIDEYCQRLLQQRQQDGVLPWFPIYSDIKEFDGEPWRGKVDIVCGGFPCQDISSAGKGAGLDGERSGLWFEMLRIICEIRPQYVFVENSPRLVSLGLHRVLGGLAESGYDAEWDVLGADDLGAPHRRKRLWILASDADRKRCNETEIYGPSSIKRDVWNERLFLDEMGNCPIWESGKRGLDCLDDGLSARLGEYKCIGNAQVPIVAAMAYRILHGRLNEKR